MSNNYVVSFEGVSKVFAPTARAETVKALTDVSLEVIEGETLAIVGESGSGKSTLARLLMKLESPSHGHIRLVDKGVARDIAQIPTRDFYRRIQMVFQDPYSSLNGRKHIWQIVSAGAANLGLVRSRSDRRAAAAEALESVGLDMAYMDAFPDHLSGGQRQRVSIARLLAAGPDIFVLDEPLSALDVSVQAQIVNLLLELQERMQLTYLFISHDLAVVRHIADKVAVMRSGQLIEYGPVDEVIDRPRHPYTRAMVDASFAIRPRLSDVGEREYAFFSEQASLAMRGTA